MNGIPIIKIQIEGMRESIGQALALHNDDFDTMIQVAVQKAFTFETIQEKINHQVDLALDDAILSISADSLIKDTLRKFVLNAVDKMNKDLETEAFRKSQLGAAYEVDGEQK